MDAYIRQQFLEYFYRDGRLFMRNQLTFFSTVGAALTVRLGARALP